MKQVIIGMKNGKPYVMSAPKSVNVTFKQPKKRSFVKLMKTLWYRIKTGA